jgi:hypothetical protein
MQVEKEFGTSLMRAATARASSQLSADPTVSSEGASFSTTGANLSIFLTTIAGENGQIAQ